MWCNFIAATLYPLGQLLKYNVLMSTIIDNTTPPPPPRAQHYVKCNTYLGKAQHMAYLTTPPSHQYNHKVYTYLFKAQHMSHLIPPYRHQHSRIAQWVS